MCVRGRERETSSDLIPVAVVHLFLDVHGQHLATERQALGLLDHLLVW